MPHSVTQTEQRISILLSGDRSLRVFEELSTDYDPSTCWLDGKSPEHPLFNEPAKIQDLRDVIKNRLHNFILDGCKILLENQHLYSFLQTFDEDKVLWIASYSMHKYGVVYLASRAECRYEFLQAIDSNLARFTEIDAFLSDAHNAIRVINYGVHEFVKCQKGMQVEHPGKLIPPNAISSMALLHIAVRPQDFEGESVSFLERTDPIWDLHDFSHHAVSSLSPTLYGSKYFTHLAKLPPRLTALIRSPGMNTAEPKPRCSDGFVFSHLLTELFTAEIGALGRGEKTHTYASLTNTLATEVAEYLLGRKGLLHKSANTNIRMVNPIKADQLASLAQNKAYELTASEMEQRIMTRGGPVGDARDVLDALSAESRIRFLASSRKWMYFEVRNTIKHRAHKLAYQKVAKEMLADDNTSLEDKDLLRKTIDAMAYKGCDNGMVLNLWETLLERQGTEGEVQRP